MGKKIEIFPVHYENPFWTLKTDIYTPIQAGRALSGNRLDMIGDDTGENISHKNLTYGEFTAMYWIWKNARSDYIGYCHYRRYFCFKDSLLRRIISALVTRDNYFSYRLFTWYGKITKYSRFRYTDTTDNDLLGRIGVFNEQDIYNLIDKHPFVVARRVNFNTSLRRHYMTFHLPEDWDLMISTVNRIHPDDRRYVETALERRRTLYPCLLFIMGRELFNEYMM